ncbi:biotin-dependent carboxyltransferase family protein [Ferrimonas balearica]|uniref:5-oxoprolinase subunit C family protein n=1 Tax=Ferrimonas balearica TaxID=44012 RepID=UPI001C9A0534|nr:biotin-dependent carboxyltransferase family protein [Ferrimonas balearica]MBY5921123.1 biotin-dependent carboxyltransferase family protein [Ferrimonas balearica]MBY5996192.1 biotin-dependent carboxyltransferase family protein [Ferrimonas balearica]
MTATVLSSGVLTTVQDLGRSGYRHLGLPAAGAVDPLAAAIANLLLAQHTNSAVLEYTLVGPTLQFDFPTVVALTGGVVNARLDGTPVPMHQPVAIPARAKLAIGPLQSGCRGYLAIKGGWQVAPQLGSVSTLICAGLGGLQGRRIRRGDALPYPRFRGAVPKGIAARVPRNNRSRTAPAPIKVIAGPEADGFRGGLSALCERVYRLSADSDRMGCRLVGPALEPVSTREPITDGVVPGTVQVPPDGQPIVLMADSQPTGGYPRMAVVASVDLPKLAQARPGDPLSFVEVSLESARQEKHHRQIALNRLAIAFAHQWQEPVPCAWI